MQILKIVYEKLVAYESEGNGRISWKKNGDQRVIENKEKTKSVCKDFLRANVTTEKDVIGSIFANIF